MSVDTVVKVKGEVGAWRVAAVWREARVAAVVRGVARLLVRFDEVRVLCALLVALGVAGCASPERVGRVWRSFDRCEGDCGEWSGCPYCDVRLLYGGVRRD